MGTRVAPTYANLFMSHLEEKLLDNHELKPKLWLRYIDDIFFIWEHGEDTLSEWISYLNNSHKSIKFTAETSRKEINFLDTKVKVGQNNKLYTDLYVKPTDTNSYLKFDSAHPPKCKESLPYSQYLRIKRICKNTNDYTKHVKQKESEFLEKGYPKEILEKAKDKVDKCERNTLLQKKEKQSSEKSDRIILTATYREGFSHVPKIVKNNWDILARSSTTKKLHRADLMIGYRKPRDLRSHLVHARTDYHPENQNIQREGKCADHENECKKKECQYCNLLDCSGEIKHKDRTLHSKKHITCNSSNVIYCIECKKCNSRYVGQTKRKIKDRLREHIYGVKNQKDTDISYHFNTNGHSGKHDMKVYILDFIYTHPESKRAKSLRNTIETNWIQRLNTQSPIGMNILDNRYG